MILVSKTYWGGLPFYFRRRPEGALGESLVLRTEDFRQIRAVYWTPGDRPSPRVAVVCMHPRVDFTHHYTFPRLLEAGIGCMGALTRHLGNDTDLEHEEILLDVAACVRYLRQRRGVEKVILLGNSGGGSLSALYQAQARRAPADRIATSPAGMPTRLPHAEMPAADALVYISTHRGQGQVLGECIDPSVTDEADPLAIDPALDMYDVRNGFRPPPEWAEYDETFVQRYRAAQMERVRRLDTMAHALIGQRQQAALETAEPEFGARPFEEQQHTLRRQLVEPVMVVYRTMANLNYVDRRLDPSGREYGSLLSDRPDLMNVSYPGFARTCTPRAWLSTWSAISSNADLVRNVAQIEEPTLMVHAGRDREIYPRTDARPAFEAVASPDRTYVEIEQARHYFEPDPGEREAPHIEQLMDVVVPWIQARF